MLMSPRFRFIPEEANKLVLAWKELPESVRQLAKLFPGLLNSGGALTANLFSEARKIYS